MDLFPAMLYKVGGKEEIHGGMYTSLIVQDADELEAALADGWAESTPDALAIAADSSIKEANAVEQRAIADIGTTSDDAPPTRSELEQKATELGIKVDARWGDKRLSDEIAAKLKVK